MRAFVALEVPDNVVSPLVDFQGELEATGADIKAIVTEAGMFALRDIRDIVQLEDFEKAINKVMSQGLKSGCSPAHMFL